jgi:aerobic carbon-monoxide dehydrogenase medium subunit
VLQPDDLIQSVRVPKLSAGARWGFYKFSQKAGEFAHAIGGVLYDPARNVFRAVIGAIETAPIVVADAAALFGGGFGSELAERLDRTSVLQRLDAKNVTDEYLRSLAAVALKRAANQACAA